MLLNPSEDEHFDNITALKLNTMNNLQVPPYVLLNGHFQDDYVSSSYDFGGTFTGKQLFNSQF